MPTFTVDLFWLDDNGKRAAHRLHAPVAQGYGGVVTAALSLAAALEAASSARLYAFTISRTFVNQSTSPIDPEADVLTDAVLLYRNGSDTASIRLPSPRGVLFEVSGPYSGRRITRASLQVSGLLPLVDSLVQGLIDPVGRPYGTNFVVGGRLR